MLITERKAMRKSWVDRGFLDPYTAFSNHRCASRKRGIEFLMTFDEWYAIWAEVYHLRGTGTNGLCMARKDDAGPYAIGNVYITTNLGNLLDYQRSERARSVRAAVRAKNYAAKDHRVPWTKKTHSTAPLVMERKIYYEEPID